ncbi:MAG: hypothetical protein PVI43_00675 [Candidatus Bathyarchaeota archaeon]|jgi:hypothetical protein
MKIVSKTVHLGKDAYVRINADGSFSALAFGSFSPNQVGLRYGWVSIKREDLPTDVIKLLEN